MGRLIKGLWIHAVLDQTCTRFSYVLMTGIDMVNMIHLILIIRNKALVIKL